MAKSNSDCAVCGARINHRNGIGFTAENPNFVVWYVAPKILRTCAKHNGAEFPKEIHAPRSY